MKAIVCEEFGPLEALKYKDVPDPVPGFGQVLVDVKAVGVNFPDALMVQGKYQVKPDLPFIPGSEFSGTVRVLGQGVESFQAGDRVIGLSPDFGAFAGKIALGANHLTLIPDGMPHPVAANLLLAHGTAHHGLKQRGQLQARESLVVLGAAGGTGIAAVQIGKAMGARVIAACSAEEKLALAKTNGADEVINYTKQDLTVAIKDLTGGKGADVVYDPVGGDAFDACSRAMARNGRLLVIGFASGQIPVLPANLPLVKEYALVGVFWGSFVLHEPDVYASNLRELFHWYADGKVNIAVDAEIPLNKTVDALTKLMNREVRGKLVLLPPSKDALRS
jgi:NADPH2:quinone reductase